MAIYNTLSDQELTDLLKSDDEGAYTVIYNRYWKLIYAYVFKMLRDEDDAKDIVQEVFGNLWIKAGAIKKATFQDYFILWQGTGYLTLLNGIKYDMIT